MPGIARRSLVVGLLCFTAYLLLTFYLYGSTLTAWWCCDDPAILKHALCYSPWEYFAVPSAWRALVPYSLTPWLTLTYDLDHLFFGLNPAGYYAHNLVTIALCACLICLVARQWVSGWYAFGGGVLFLVGAPVMVASHQLMVRHYIEGLFFYLLALWLLLWAFQRGNSRLGWLAGIAFAIAATAKEIYLPLGFLLFLLPIGNFRQRLKVGWPILAVMALYVPWRRYMLGDVVGGYTPVAELGLGDLTAALKQFFQIPRLLLAYPWLPLCGLLSLVVLLLFSQKMKLKSLLLPVFILLLLLVPLVPLARQPGIGAGSERYFIAIWAALAVGSSIITGLSATGGGIRIRLFSVVTMAVLLISARLHAEQVKVTLIPGLNEQSAQGKALITSDSHEVIYLTPAVAVWYISGIVDLKQALGRTTPFPALVSDEIELYRLARAGRHILRYNRASQRMEDITTLVPQMLNQWRTKVRPVPLSVEMVFDGAIKTMRWQLGPYVEGSYTMLPGYGRQQLPLKGTLRMENPPDGTYTFRYDSPVGWIAYTPLLTFVAATQGKSRLAMQGPGLSVSQMGGATK